MSRADLTQRAGATEKAGMAVLILVEWGYLLRGVEVGYLLTVLTRQSGTGLIREAI